MLKRSVHPLQKEFANPFNRAIFFIELLLIFSVSCLPLFLTFPYHINIFLSWEGAYRLYLGQIPFKDFGLPLGIGYWLIPAFFFRLFGPKLFTLIYAQVFINMISGLAFRSILRSLGLDPGLRLVGIVLYIISFSFFNFLPWYNHTNIVFEFIGFAALLKFIFRPESANRLLYLAGAAFFFVLSFFTKQDGGAMGIALSLAIMLINLLYERRFLNIAAFTGFLVLFFGLFILPFIPYHIGYWFNHGQAPHSSRISLPEITETLLNGSEWIKFYFLMIILLTVLSARSVSRFFSDQKETIFLFLTLGLLAEASIYQVTSYTPPDMNIFYHSFAFTYILSHLGIAAEFRKVKIVLLTVFLVLIWWSGAYYRSFNKYINRFLPQPSSSAQAFQSSTGKSDGIHENIINRHTYILTPPDTLLLADTARWVLSTMPSFAKVLMPPGTVKGMNAIAALKVLSAPAPVMVLNMTELTPLERDLHFKLETGSDIPLWHHLGVGMFQQQTTMYAGKVKHNFYPLVLFEYIPNLNNFYPFRLRDTLQKYYIKVLDFPAPRRPNLGSRVEVYEPRSGPDVPRPASAY